MCVSPVSSDDALGDGVSYLVENVPVVCTADEELILGANQKPSADNNQRLISKSGFSTLIQPMSIRNVKALAIL